MTNAVQRAQRDPLDQLLLAELDEGSRLLKTDMVSAISEGTVDRWQALAIAAWLLARRKDPKVKLNEFRQLRPTEVYERLDIGDDDQVDDEEAADPTASASASS